MNEQGPSKRNKRSNNKLLVKPGSLSILAKRKRHLQIIKDPIQAIRSEKERLLKSIEHPPLAQQAKTIEQRVEEQTIEEQPVEENPVEQRPVEQSEEQAEVVPTKNTRGSTHMHKVHARKERKVILLNRTNQPIGPNDEDMAELSSFLGTLGKNATLCPFDVFDWRKMDGKDDIWEYIQMKYDISEKAKDWALERVRDAWRNHRRLLKTTHYDPYDNDKDRMANGPKDIPECQFKALLIYWKSEKFKKMSETNTASRKMLMNPHTTGRKSFALIRENLEKEKEIVSPKEMFIATRVRNPDRSYKVSHENTATKIAEMENIEAQASADGQSIDAFAVVMGPEHPGRLRLYGGGVTKTSLKRITANYASNSRGTNDVVQEMQQRVQKMEEEMEEQKRTIRREVFADVIAQLRVAGLIDPNVLATLEVPSSRESTAQPATGRNNQGGQIEEEDENDEAMM